MSTHVSVDSARLTGGKENILILGVAGWREILQAAEGAAFRMTVPGGVSLEASETTHGLQLTAKLGRSALHVYKRKSPDQVEAHY